MTKIDLTPLEMAAETERKLAHERIERLTWERNVWCGMALMGIVLTVLKAVLL